MDTITAHPYAAVAVGVLAAGTLYYLYGGGFGKTSRAHCSVIAGPGTADSSPIYQNHRVKPGDELVCTWQGHSTLYDTFQGAVKKWGNHQCLGSRPFIQDHKVTKEIRGEKREWSFPELGSYKFMTYNEAATIVDHLGSGLMKLGLKATTNVALFMETREEWTLTAQACFSQNLVVMTVYANLGEEALIFGLNQAEARVMITTGELLGMIAKYISQLKYLGTLVYADEKKANQKDIDALIKAGIKLYTYNQLQEMGKANPVPHNPPSPDDLAVLMYTSGSTGMPKGVMCRHRNCMGSIAGVLSAIQVIPGDVHLSYLPLAHILAFVVEQGCLASGVLLCYGNPRTLSDTLVKNCKGDIAEARPNFLIGVPTVFDKIKAGILEKVNASSTSKTIFETAYAQKKAAVAEGKDTPLWNRLVFNKMKAAIGGRVRLIVTGGAPLSKECGEFLHVCFGVPVLQGYALTETCAGGTLGDLDDLTSVYNIGPPIASVQMKLVDCPEMGYTHKDEEGPRGEIWIRGPSVTSGYFKNPEKTAEDFVDGWFKTGDIGKLNPNGTFSIIDRKKNLVKPPHGEYIAVERLESTYKNCPLVANIMVYASHERNEVVALVHPNKGALEKWAATQGLGDESFEDLCKDPKANKAVLNALNQTWKETNLKSIERISAVALYAEEWTPANGWLTAAMKISRPFVQKEQAKVIQDLYKNL